MRTPSRAAAVASPTSRRRTVPVNTRPGTLAGVGLAQRPVGYTPRRDAGLAGFERVLARAGLYPVVGIDEAGRGACAGPLVVAAVTLGKALANRNVRRGGQSAPPGRGRGRSGGEAPAELADSKALTANARRRAYEEIVTAALAWNVVLIPPEEIDRFGLHVCNIAGMRRALAGLDVVPGYILTDGFEVPGLTAPALAMWKGDQVAASVAAASIVAKVTRDSIMEAEHERYPEYGFARHKGYSTPSHLAALDAFGPSPLHRRSFVNVASRLNRRSGGHNLAAGRPADSDDGPDGPIVEVVAGSLACAPGLGADQWPGYPPHRRGEHERGGS